MLGKCVSVCGGVSLGEGGVKGPLPDGPLTLWSPVAPSQPAHSVAGERLTGLPSSPTRSLEPREAQRETSPTQFLEVGQEGTRFQDQSPKCGN